MENTVSAAYIGIVVSRIIMSGIRADRDEALWQNVGRIDNGTVAAAATAHVESLVPRGGHAHTELDGVDLSTHTYALVDLAIDKAMLWQTLGSRGKDGRRDNDLRDGGAGKRRKGTAADDGSAGSVCVGDCCHHHNGPAKKPE